MATDLAGILIVDDNEDNRYTLQLMLESDGHERIASAGDAMAPPMTANEVAGTYTVVATLSLIHI